jgi:hypothetical protein
MLKVAYSTSEAAAAASVSEHAIRVAIKAGDLVARSLGDTILVAHPDLTAWVLSLPPFQS